MVTKSQVVSDFNVAKSRLHCMLLVSVILLYDYSNKILAEWPLCVQVHAYRFGLPVLHSMLRYGAYTYLDTYSPICISLSMHACLQIDRHSYLMPWNMYVHACTPRT